MQGTVAGPMASWAGSRRHSTPSSSSSRSSRKAAYRRASWGRLVVSSFDSCVESMSHPLTMRRMSSSFCRAASWCGSSCSNMQIGWVTAAM